MVVSDLKAIIAPQADVTIWAVDNSRRIDCPFMGACKSLPDGLLDLEVIELEACSDDIEITIRTEDLERKQAFNKQVDAELDDMLSWANIRR